MLAKKSCIRLECRWSRRLDVAGRYSNHPPADRATTSVTALDCHQSWRAQTKPEVFEFGLRGAPFFSTSLVGPSSFHFRIPFEDLFAINRMAYVCLTCKEKARDESKVIRCGICLFCLLCQALFLETSHDRVPQCSSHSLHQGVLLYC